MIKKTWIDKVTELSEFHRSRLEDKPSWTIRDTAKHTKWSNGKVSEYLMISDWLKSHPEIAKFKTIQLALDFIRRKKFVRRIS